VASQEKEVAVRDERPFRVLVDTDGVVRLHVVGPIDVTTVPVLVASLQEHCDTRPIVIELADVAFLGASAATALREAIRSLPCEVTFDVRQADEPVRRVVDLLDDDG
jgi:anti-anti-sigma regulatory factor